ncbi:MAG: hypothetical protein ACKOEO_24255 [Planctomycetaceae bacterium]
MVEISRGWSWDGETTNREDCFFETQRTQRFWAKTGEFSKMGEWVGGDRAW